MAYWSPESSFETLKNRVTETVKNYFPIKGKVNTLKATKVWVDDDLHIDDIKSQRDTKLKGRSWTVPVRAEFALIDNETGKVKDRQALTVAQLPKVTRRYSYIVNGNEWQVANQFRLKSGAYTRIKANGELEGQWNLVKGLGFRMEFDPSSREMTLKYKGSHVPLYPVLKNLGVSDDDIEKKWGKSVLSANMAVNEDSALKKFYKAHLEEAPKSVEDARSFLVKTFDETVLRPDSAKLTLGKPFDKVTGDALLTGSHRLLKVARQEEEPDDRDSLEFKDLWSAEDLVAERLSRGAQRRDIIRKISNTLDKHSKVRSIVNPDFIGKPIRQFFTSSTLADRPDQTNPLSFLVGNRQTTILGEGGVSEERRLTPEARGVNPSHIGFLDPIVTPESPSLGAVLQLASGVRKEGHDLKVRAYDTKTKKTVWITPEVALHSNLALPDQYVWKEGTPTPAGKTVKISDPKGNLVPAKPGEVDYILKSSRGMFDLVSNMIPFLQNDQGNRTMVAAKQVTQAVPLKYREAPLVQTKGDTGISFEAAIGSFNSHRSPVDGKIVKVQRDSILIRDNEGKRHEVQLYDDFPMNDPKSILNSEARVEVGDSVKKGQLVSDTNFTDKGILALGTNLRVAYMPYRGYNFEDATVISESAAKKLTSEHMFRENLTAERNIILDKKKFLAETAGTTTKDQADKLDDDGIIREGQQVNPGDILIGMMRKEEVSPEGSKIALISKKLVKPVRARPITWDKDFSGVVSRVARHGKLTTVFVKAETPADIGDKIVGRHGNKGLISVIVPDKEMPTDKEGNPVEVIYSPASVPTRINLGQVLETAAGKIAKKTGKPYLVSNFDPSNKDYTRSLLNELQKHGLSDTEDLIDPRTNRTYKDVLVGSQYILKLHHTADKGLQARSRDAYDSNMAPKGGGSKSGQKMDHMGLYALLAHNARENIREAQTVKSEHNDDFWNHLQAGDGILPPKVPFAYKKFEGYLKALGVDVRKDGNALVLSPLTDKQVLAKGFSNGEIKDPQKLIRGKDARPEPGGLFDPKVTGTQWPLGKLGDKWSHITLAERLPNPVFEKPILGLLGLSGTDFRKTLSGSHKINGKTGPKAIMDALKDLDIGKEISRLEGQSLKLSGNELNATNKKLKYLKALQRSGLSPEEAYTTKYLPVIPPIMRPLAVQDNGEIKYNDLNGLYKRIGNTNHQLKTFDPGLPPEDKHELHAELYDGLKSLTLTGAYSQGRYLSGIAETIAGTEPKEGYFQSKVIGKRQDMSMRGTIVPEPSLSLDEVAIPRKAAMEIYKPFIVQRLRGMAIPPLQAQEMIKKNHPTAMKALEAEVEWRPLLLKRDPVLHKYGVQAFKPRLIEGKAIKIHPLVTAGFNADFDGDRMAAFVPISRKAVDEAYRMMPSHNLFNPSSGRLMYKPDHEAMLGLYKLTEVGKDTGIRFRDAEEAAKALKEGKIDFHDVIEVLDIDKKDVKDLLKVAAATRTTVGRLALYYSLPEELRDKSWLTDPSKKMTKDQMDAFLSTVAKNKPAEYSVTADQLKDAGNEFSTGISIGLKDFLSDTEGRNPILDKAILEEAKIRTSKLPTEKKDAAIVDLYTKASKELDDVGKARYDKSKNRMYDWVKSGARGKWSQFKQMVMAPVLVADSRGKPVPAPITKSYSEGLDVGSYWSSMHGARMGTYGRVQGTEIPGTMSKNMMGVAMDQVIVSDDCGTKKGVLLPTEDRDVLDRYTAEDIQLSTRTGRDKGLIPAGTLVTPDVVGRLKNNRVSEITVRSPLKCVHGKGLCAKCYGLNELGHNHSLGTNVGVIAVQALGEPAVQLSMNSFHEGGTVGAKGTGATSKFSRILQLVEMPKILPGAATLSKVDGDIEKIEKDPAGGWGVYVKGQRHFVPSRRELSVKTGDSVRKGEVLSTGVKNPLEMLELTQNLGLVQKYLTDELWDAYKSEGPVRKRNVETFVRALTNLGRVRDPGDHPEYIRGDYAPLSEVNHFNSQLPAKSKAVQVDPVLRPTSVLPKDLQSDWIARMNTRKLKETLVDAAAEGWKSYIHGGHPVPGMAYGKFFGTGTPEEPWAY